MSDSFSNFPKINDIDNQNSQQNDVGRLKFEKFIQQTRSSRPELAAAIQKLLNAHDEIKFLLNRTGLSFLDEDLSLGVDSGKVKPTMDEKLRYLDGDAATKIKNVVESLDERADFFKKNVLSMQKLVDEARSAISNSTNNVDGIESLYTKAIENVAKNILLDISQYANQRLVPSKIRLNELKRQCKDLQSISSRELPLFGHLLDETFSSFPTIRIIDNWINCHDKTLKLLKSCAQKCNQKTVNELKNFLKATDTATFLLERIKANDRKIELAAARFLRSKGGINSPEIGRLNEALTNLIYCRNSLCTTVEGRIGMSRNTRDKNSPISVWDPNEEDEVTPEDYKKALAELKEALKICENTNSFKFENYTTESLTEMIEQNGITSDAYRTENNTPLSFN